MFVLVPDEADVGFCLHEHYDATSDGDLRII